MTPKLQGTFLLDGLIEGRLPTGGEGAQHLEQWIRFASDAGLVFKLEIDGGSFSLLADNTPAPVARAGPNVTEKLVAAVDELLKLFTPAERTGVYSTLRSTEYRPGSEVQTLYVVGPDGKTISKQRVVEAETVAAAPRLAVRAKLKRAGIGLAVVLVVLAASTLFVDYRGLLGRVKDAVVPVRADEVAVDASAFRKYFTVADKHMAERGTVLVLTLKRVASPMPSTQPNRGSAATLPASARPGTQPTVGLDAGDVSAIDLRLVDDAVARGYVRCEYFDANGKFLEAEFKRIKELRVHDSMQIAVPTRLQAGDGTWVRIHQIAIVP